MKHIYDYKPQYTKGLEVVAKYLKTFKYLKDLTLWSQGLDM